MRCTVALVAAGLILSGCAGSKAVQMPAASTNVYQLGAGDSLRVIVYGEDKLNGEYRVGDNGAVTLPLIGSVAAEGKSVEEFSAAVAESYRTGGFLNSPKVAAEVIAYRPFFVLGEVNKPGQYPFIPGMTIRQAIATANGYTYRAKQSEVMVTHWRQKQESTFRLDAAATVAPGDTIRVPERHF